jgi:hypothetical protein
MCFPLLRGFCFVYKTFTLRRVLRDVIPSHFSYAVYVHVLTPGIGGVTNNAFIGQAMAHAATLFDQHSAQGNVQQGTTQDAVSSAASTAMNLLSSSSGGAGSGGSGIAGLLLGGGSGGGGAGQLLGLLGGGSGGGGGGAGQLMGLVGKLM